MEEGMLCALHTDSIFAVGGAILCLTWATGKSIVLRILRSP
jgi:hypothetical protein